MNPICLAIAAQPKSNERQAGNHANYADKPSATTHFASSIMRIRGATLRPSAGDWPSKW
jgi:hypothetical protein